MASRRWKTFLPFSVLLLAAWQGTSLRQYLVAAPPAAGSRIEIAVIVHPQTPVDNLTLAEVRNIFRGERQFWTSNLRVVLIVRAPVTHERQVLLDTVYQMSEAQFKQFWIGKIFRAEATGGPKIVYSGGMTGELVAAVPGSIAVVDAAKVPPGVKIVRVDGLLPGQKGYRLQ